MTVWQKIIFLLLLYWLAVNGLASLLTLIDKWKAQRDRWRIPESSLLLVAFLGGAIGMYLTMKKIRHKTRHAKFMIGLPAIMVVHLLLLGALAWFLFR